METIKLVHSDGRVLAEMLYSKGFITTVTGLVEEGIEFRVVAGPQTESLYFLNPDGSQMLNPGE